MEPKSLVLSLLLPAAQSLLVPPLPSTRAAAVPFSRCSRAPLACAPAEPPATDAAAAPGTEADVAQRCDYPGCVDGRVMGGLPAIEIGPPVNRFPPFGWWPIKPYRPCPECAKRGMKYTRSGQTLDEIVFKKNPAGGYYGDDED